MVTKRSREKRGKSVSEKQDILQIYYELYYENIENVKYCSNHLKHSQKSQK